MQKVRVGINGFGRIGRQVFRALHAKYQDKVEVVAINDLFDAETNFHLLEYDTNYGRANLDAVVEGDNATVGDWKIHCFAERDPKLLTWGAYGVDVVVESTGIFRSAKQAHVHIENGAKKVIITAPAKEEDLTIVMGVNHNDYDPAKHHVVSNASCTTNCLAPVALVVERLFGIVSGAMTTVHAYTNDQRILDLPHKDLRRARAAACNIIPTSTGAAKAVGRVIPSLKGKMTGMAFRVPTADVSVVDLTARLSRTTTYAEICYAIRHASETYMKDIIGYTTDQVVSTDLIGNPCPCIFDETAGIMLDHDFVKLIAWYDNEWGYSNMVVRMLRHMYEQDQAAQ